MSAKNKTIPAIVGFSPTRITESINNSVMRMGTQTKENVSVSPVIIPINGSTISMMGVG